MTTIHVGRQSHAIYQRNHRPPQELCRRETESRAGTADSCENPKLPQAQAGGHRGGAERAAGQGGGLLVKPLLGHLPVSISQPTASPPSATASSSTDAASSSVTARSWGSPDVHTQRKGPNPRENMSLQRQKASWRRGFPAWLHPLMGAGPP